MNCYKCDTLLEKDWNYCPNCKRKIKKSKLNEEELISTDEAGKCHKCSFDLNDNWNFCPVCGTAVEFISDKPKVSVPIIAAANDEPNKGLDPRETEENELLSDTILCPNCGVKVLENQPFCAQCGEALNSANVVKSTEGKGLKSYFWVVLAFVAPVLGFLLSFYLLIPVYDISILDVIPFVLSVIFSIYSMISVMKNRVGESLMKTLYIIYVVCMTLFILGSCYVLGIIFLCGFYCN